MPFLRRGEGGEKPRERGLLSVLFLGMGALRFCEHACQTKRRQKNSTRKKFEKVFFMVVIVIFVSFVF